MGGDGLEELLFAGGEELGWAVEEDFGPGVAEEGHGVPHGLGAIGIDDAMGGAGDFKVHVAAEHIAGIGDDFAGLGLHGVPVAIAIHELEAGFGGGGEKGDEVDIFVGGGAHAAFDIAIF